MTMEEIENKLSLSFYDDYSLSRDVKGMYDEAIDTIDKIYDDFNSRICENCKHWTREHFELGVCNENVDTEHIMDIAEGVTKASFGCLKFKRKEL